jgi:uncharacterized protein YycO
MTKTDITLLEVSQSQTLDKVNLYVFAVKGKGLGPFVIRFFTRSVYSHVGIFSNDENLGYESITKKGVVAIKKLSDDKDLDLLVIKLLPQQREQILNFLNQQLGKAYDWKAVINVLNYKRDWRENDKWFCSELVARAFEIAGIRLLNKPCGRITPADVVSSPLLSPIM